MDIIYSSSQFSRNLPPVEVLLLARRKHCLSLPAHFEPFNHSDDDDDDHHHHLHNNHYHPQCPNDNNHYLAKT